MLFVAAAATSFVLLAPGPIAPACRAAATFPAVLMREVAPGESWEEYKARRGDADLAKAEEEYLKVCRTRARWGCGAGAAVGGGSARTDPHAELQPAGGSPPRANTHPR